MPPASHPPNRDDAGPSGGGGGAGIAAAAASLGVALFLLARAASGPSLAALAAASFPLDEALRSGHPTVIEFYADWCTLCKESAPRVDAAVRAAAGSTSSVNLVMLNVDNNAWTSEMSAYGVDGIPHFVFLDANGVQAGSLVGRLPQDVLEADVAALRDGRELPYVKAVFSPTALQGRSGARPEASPAAPSSDPRAHS